jgi:putative flippase GtrA
MPGHLRVGLVFVSVGAMNTMVGLLIIFGCKRLAGLGDIPANAIGYGFGIVLSFVLNRTWTFGHRGAIRPAFIRFLIVNGVAYLLNLVSVLIAIHALGINGYIAQVLGVGPYALTTYLGSRYFAFALASPRLR